MRKISFQKKNNLIVKYKSAEFFMKDLELFKKYYSGHSLNNDLAKANKFSFARYDGQMISLLLDVISIEDILKNRTQEEDPETESRTEDEIRTLLIEKFKLDEADMEALSEIIPLWLNKTDQEIISAVKKLLGGGTTPNEETEDSDKTEGDKDGDKTVGDENGNKTVGDEDGDKTVGDENGDKEVQTEDRTSESQTSERDNVKKITQRINEATTIQDVEAILKEDKEGGERSTVQNAGLKRIEILKEALIDTNDKKKDQNTTNSPQ